MTQDVNIRCLYQVKLHCCTCCLPKIVVLQCKTQIFPKGLSDKTKTQASWGHNLVSLAEQLQKRVITVCKVQENCRLVVISEIEPLVTRQISLSCQSESALGSLTWKDYKLALLVSSVGGLSCIGKALQWEPMLKHQHCFRVQMIFRSKSFCIWSLSLPNGRKKSPQFVKNGVRLNAVGL